jgi:small-conductance mechanosensitive channel
MDFFQELQKVLINYYYLAVEHLPRLVLGIIVLMIALTLAGRLKQAIRNRLGKTMDDPLLADFLALIFKVIFVIISFLLFFGIIGVSGLAGGLLAGAGMSAFIIGFAFKDIGENFLAGIIMAFDRPFRIGDTVTIGGHTGKIIYLTLRDTHVKTFDGKDVYIPNGMIVRNPIVNLTIDGFLRHDFTVRLASDSDMDQVVAFVKEVLERVEGVLQEDRAPNIFISDYQPSGMTLTVQYWFNTADPNVSSLALKTQVIQRTVRGLKGAGYHLPAEVREITITREAGDRDIAV